MMEMSTAFNDACVLSAEILQWRKRFTRLDTGGLFGTAEYGNVSLNSFWQVK
jgi:hypothetical protein